MNDKMTAAENSDAQGLNVSMDCESYNKIAYTSEEEAGHLYGTIPDCEEIAQPSLVVMTEQELATWLAERGMNVVCHNGRYWRETYPGFFAACHPLARMSEGEATRPTPFCWGFRSSLRDADAGTANGSVPLHLLTDIANYTWQTRSPRCRNKLRNLRKQVDIVALHKPDLLLDQGYNILYSAHARNSYGKVPKRSDYQKNIERYYASGRGLVLGGLVDGKLAGYLTSYAIGTTAYVDELFLDSRYLNTNISLGLFFDWMQICRRTVAIREVVHGLHAREAVGLCRHKIDLGLQVVHIPARIWFAPFADAVVKKLRPHVYYRLTGHD